MFSESFNVLGLRFGSEFRAKFFDQCIGPGRKIEFLKLSD